MNQLSHSENDMWRLSEHVTSRKMTAHEINEKYVRGEQRIITESNREKLPNFVEALNRPDYMNLRPFYQRRVRWSADRQSRLIESFIINVPVPPVFLYEKAYNSYEVMDGQQRITAIKDFYENQLKLTGLELWPELNGMRYNELPSKIKAGIDRRSISSIVLLKESAPDDEEAIQLRQLVFERLNTGGVKLERQEIRNALYQSPLNDLLLDLARMKQFRDAWELPEYTEDEQTNHNLPIFKIPFFQQMDDLEVILRFFALRHIQYFRNGMQGFLDLYMLRSANFDKDDISDLRNLFTKTLDLASNIYKQLIFRPYDAEKDGWAKRPQRAFQDAVMVGLSSHLDQSKLLIEKREKILESTAALFRKHERGTFTGAANTKDDVENRIRLFDEMLHEIITN
jgi:hypothetical protein